MKKILIVSGTFFPNIGGIEEQIRILGTEYLKQGFTVDILTKRIEKQWSKSESIFGMNVTRFANSFEQVSFLLKYGNEYEIIISRWFYRHSLILGLLKLLKTLKTTTIICTDTGGENDEIITIKKALLPLKLYKLYFYIIGKNNYLNCLTIENVRHLKEVGISEKQITRIYNGIDISLAKQNSKKKSTIENILFLGRFEKQKGIFDTINAFKQIENPAIILNIIGYGNQETEEKIKNMITCDNRIIYHGKKYGNRKEILLDSMDLFILPSYSEGQPISISEMIIRDIPIITTDTGNNREIYGDDLVYVKAKDTNDLQEKIEWIITNSGVFHYNYNESLKKIDIKHVASSFLDLKK